jgi:hypothetical protein
MNEKLQTTSVKMKTEDLHRRFEQRQNHQTYCNMSQGNYYERDSMIQVLNASSIKKKLHPKFFHC